MDWKKITDTMTPYVTKAKEYGKKAAKFAENQIQATPLFIKTQGEYDDLIVEKRVVIIAYDEKQDDITTEIRLLSTVWLTRAFMDTAKLRFITLSESAEFASQIDMVGPVDMRVRFEGEETFRFTNIVDIKKWWQSPIYKNGDTENVPKKEVPIDPLAGK